MNKHSNFDRCARLLAASFTATLLLATTANADWPYWRGPLFNGTADATGLPDSWNPKGGAGSNVLWTRDDLGGPCTPIEMNGRLYSIQRSEPGTNRDGEKVICLDARTGSTIWETRYNVWMSDVPAERVGWSSVVGDHETGNVYALGSCDIFQCFHGETGEVLWSIPLHEQFGMLSTYGGRTNFPVIHEDLVIISGILINWGDAAKPNHRLIGMNKRTGEVVWISGTRDLPDDTTYSAPSIVTIDGQRQLILGTGDGAIWSFQPRTGKPLWHYDLSLRGIFATPLVAGNRVFCSTSEENVAPLENVMGAVAAVRVSGTGEDTHIKELWKQPGVVVGRSAPVLIGERLYVVDDRSKMWIFDAETGTPIVERKALGVNAQFASLVHADNKIYVMGKNGWAILKPTDDGFEIISKGRLRDGEFIASPIVAGGRLYFQSSLALYCVGTADGQQTQIKMADSMGTESPVTENPSVAQLQIVPAEALVKPGEQIELSVNAFNSIGQPVETPPQITFAVRGPGSITGSTFTADATAAHTAAIITASSGSVTATARIRIVPGLPWKFTFDDLSDPPLSWIGARYRHQIRPVDGSPALVKITTIPKGARSRAWLGPSDLAGYTISADVRGARTEDQLPDIGLTAHGYAMDLMGQHQQVEIRSWSAQERMAKQVKFPWQENTWYRMKLRVDIESEPPAAVALVRGKIWPRDEPEPDEWTVTVRDESPNLSASPGLYGNAKVAELYLDNLEVTANTNEPSPHE
jgi:outer membrane protein assembly factor BamB